MEAHSRYFFAVGCSPEATTGLDLNHTLYLVLTLLSEKPNQHLRLFITQGL